MSNVLHGDEISSALSSPIISELQQDAQDATDLATSITDFVTNSKGMLSGPGWEKVGAKMSEFGEVMNERMQLATAFGEAIQEALQMCLDFLAAEPAVDSLDAADLEEITETKKAAEADRDFILAHMNDKKTVYGTRKNPDTGVEEQYSYEENIYDVAACQAKVDALNEDIAYAEKLIAKIAEMETVIATVMGMLDEAYSKVSEFGNKVGNLTPSGRWHYDSTIPYTPTSTTGDHDGDVDDPASPTEPARRVMFTDGNITIYEGDEVARREDGTILYINHPDGSWTSYNSDGSVQREVSSDGVSTWYHEGHVSAVVQPDGSGVGYYDDGSVSLVLDSDGAETRYDKGTYFIGEDGTRTTVRETGSRLVENPDGTSAVYDANGVITQSWDGRGNMSMYTDGQLSATQGPNGTYTTYYPDGSVREARDISGTTYNFQQGENVRTVAPVSEVPLEYNEVGNMPPNTTFDEDGYIVIRDDHGVILDRINPVYTPTDNGTDITYQDPANGNQIIIHSPYGGTNS